MGRGERDRGDGGAGTLGGGEQGEGLRRGAGGPGRGRRCDASPAARAGARGRRVPAKSRQLDATEWWRSRARRRRGGLGSTPRPPPSTRPCLVLSPAEYLADSTSLKHPASSSQASTTGSKSIGADAAVRPPPAGTAPVRLHQVRAIQMGEAITKRVA